LFLFLIHMYPISPRGAATRNTSNINNSFFMVIGALVVVGGGYIQHERVTRDRRGWKFLLYSPS